MPDDTTTDETTTDESGTLDFDTWLKSQDDTVKGLLDGHTKGLKSSLEKERKLREKLGKDIKEMTGKLEAGSDAAKQLTEISGKLETEQKRADFYEKATAAGCRNLRLAWLAASADDLTIEQVKAANPELFGVMTKATTNAGNGAGSGGGGEKQDMNSLIRKRAGYS